MDQGLRFSFLFTLSICLMVADARVLDISSGTIMQIKSQVLASMIKPSEVTAMNEQPCALCQEFTAEAVNSLSQNKTQTDIIDYLHQACSWLHSLKRQCVVLVDYYVPIFFMEVGHTSPEIFCENVNLCEERKYFKYASPRVGDGFCTLCHQAAVEILMKLKEPDTQLEIINMITKACDKLENYAQQCKKLVFEYVPAIMINTETFLETTDICRSIHACKASKERSVDRSISSQ